MRELLLIPLVVAACANPGGPYSDLASATLGDPGVDGGIAGNVDFTNQGCELADGACTRRSTWKSLAGHVARSPPDT